MPDKKIAGIPQTPLLVGLGVAALTGIYLWLHRAKKTTPTASATTVITGSTSSSTGISGSMLNAILKDWQENGTGTTSTTSKTTTSKTSTGTTKTTKTTTPVKTSKTTTGTAKKPKSFKTITVRAGQTLDQLAKQYGITPAELAQYNVYVAGEAPGKKAGTPLGTGAGLKTGQVLKVPVY